MELLRFIKRARGLGFTLAEVEELLHLMSGGPDNCDDARALAEHRRADLEHRIRDLQVIHGWLTDLAATGGLPHDDRSHTLFNATEHPETTR